VAAILIDSALSLPERITSVSRRPASLGQVPPGAISWAMGEPDGDTSAPVVEAAVRSLRAGRTHYAPLTGSNELREALARWVTSTSGRPTTVAEIVPTTGRRPAWPRSCSAWWGPGDRVIVPEPTYSLYADHLAIGRCRADLGSKQGRRMPRSRSHRVAGARGTDRWCCAIRPTPPAEVLSTGRTHPAGRHRRAEPAAPAIRR
jgi:hypothetical protein